MTCIEKIRQKEKSYYNRLDNYMKAIDENKTDKYHDQHGRGKNKKII